MYTYLHRIEFDGKKVTKLNQTEVIEWTFEAASDDEARGIAAKRWAEEDGDRRGSKTSRMKRKSALYRQIAYP